MPDYSQMPLKGEVSRLLKELGHPIGDFNQGAFRTQIAVTPTTPVVTRSRYLNRPLGGGYCNGVCIDWARRVLLSGPDRDEGYLTYHYETLKSPAGRTGKPGHKRTAEQSHLRAAQNVGVMADAYALANSLGWSRIPGGGPDDREVSSADWTTRARGLDDRFDRERRGAKRAESSKRFSDMELLVGKSSVYASTTQCMNELFANGFRPGTVTKFGFSAPSASGHAVAAWQRKASVTDPDAFYFFDPNFGVIACSKDNMRKAVEILFYKHADHIPMYATCASETAQEMEFQIFGLSGGRTRLVTAVPMRATATVASPPTPDPSISTSATPPAPRGPSATAMSAPLPTPGPPASTPVTTGTTPGPATSSSGPVNPYCRAPGGLPTPGTNVRPPAPAAGTGGSRAGLKADLVALLNDPTKKKDKRAGKVSADGQGFVHLEHRLIEGLLDAGINFKGPAAMKRGALAGVTIQVVELQSFINMLG